MSLSELRVRALLLAAGESSVARDVATAAGIEGIDVQVDPTSPAGTFTVSDWLIDTHTKQLAGLPNDERPAPDDVALVLQTSGTTARPKIVPLRHRHLAASARHIAAALGLGPGDRCLNVMPLFHVHGLMACLLASLAAGGSVFCVPGFNAHRFFSDLAESDATWYSAVPTIHQVVLARAARHQGRRHRTRLRFIRSSSAALPPVVLHELEATFGVPVIEAYGMTEAAHQMASNPLPPGVRRPGTVGLASGSDLAVMDERGYYKIVGRKKDMYICGGFNVYPREIEEFLFKLNAVENVSVIGVPDPKFGEVGMAVIKVTEGERVTEEDIITYCKVNLANFKVPRYVWFIDEFPMTQSGKVQKFRLREMAVENFSLRTS